MKIQEMEKISDFYFEELIDMLDENGNFVIPEHRFFKLRHDEVSSEDFESIAQFGRIVKNYSKMKLLSSSITVDDKYIRKSKKYVDNQC